MENIKNITPEELERAAKEAQRKYNKEWQQNNRDKVREYHHRYWLKKAAQLLEERQALNDHN